MVVVLPAMAEKVFECTGASGPDQNSKSEGAYKHEHTYLLTEGGLSKQERSQKQYTYLESMKVVRLSPSFSYQFWCANEREREITDGYASILSGNYMIVCV